MASFLTRVYITNQHLNPRPNGLVLGPAGQSPAPDPPDIHNEPAPDPPAFSRRLRGVAFLAFSLSAPPEPVLSDQARSRCQYLGPRMVETSFEKT